MGQSKITIIRSIRRQDLERAQEDINKYINDLEEDNEKLKEVIRTYNKETEIQKLNELISHIRHNSLHISTDEEKRQIKEFSRKHYEQCKGKTELTIIGTGIGNVLEAKCSKCHEKKDVTDIDNW